MFGGDEVGALVVDIGSSISRFGFAGEDTPKAVFDTTLGYSLEAQVSSSAASAMRDDTATSSFGTAEAVAAAPRRRFYTGRSQHVCRENMEILSPLQAGLVSDWEAVEALWDFALNRHLTVNAANHPLLIAEANHNTHAHREKLAKLAFEKYNVPAIFLAKEAPLAAFSAGKATALVIDSGSAITSTYAVNDGYLLHKASQRTSFAGDTLDLLNEHISFTSKQQVLTPRYQLKRELHRGEMLSRAASAAELPANVSASYHRFQVLELLRDIKASVCRVSEAPFDPKQNSKVQRKSYDLPDGNILDLGPERFEAGEYLWGPLPAELQSLQAPEPNRVFAFNGLQQMCRDTVWACDPDMRKELVSNIVAAGGTMLSGGVTQRLSHELTSVFSDASFKVKILSVASNTERRFASWVGGSILASLGSFHQMWFSKKEYEDKGAVQLAHKCP
jgi:actin-like protein 6A